MTIPLIRYPSFRPYSNIQPFTVQDGATYALQIETLLAWIKRDLVPHIDKEISELAANWDESALELISTWEEMSASLIERVEQAEAALSDAVSASEAAKIAAEAARDLAALYASQAEAIQDAAISGITADIASDTRILLDTLYAGVSDLQTTNDALQTTNDALQTTNDILETGRLSEIQLNATFARVLNVVGAGIDPTGVTDSGVAINAIFAQALPGDTIRFPEGVYRKAVQTNVPDGVTVRMGGATVRHESGTACFVMGSRSVLDGEGSGIIDMSDWVSAGGSRAHVRFGDYNTGAGVRGGAARGLTLTGGHDDINGVFITGDTSGVNVQDIEVPDNAKMGRPVLVHWGNADNHNETPTHTAGSPTTHPHGITIRRVNTGKLTFTGGTVSVVCLSACYDVTVEDVTVEQCNELINVFPGDYGFTYAAPAIAAIGMAGINIKRTVAYKVSTVGVIVSGRPQFATGSRTRPRVVVEDARVYGGSSSGFMSSYSEDVEFRRCVAEGFALLGFNAGNEARNTRAVDCEARGNGRSGFGALGATGSEAYRTTFKRCRAFGNGIAGTVDNQKAGFVTQSARYTTIEECETGDESGETQVYGVYHSTNSLGDRIVGNEIRAVAPGGTGIFVTSGYDADTSVDRNRYGASVLTTRNTLSARTPTVNERREGQNTAPPTSGVWMIGDFVWNSAPTSSGILGWVCTGAGAPGTWKPVTGIGS